MYSHASIDAKLRDWDVCRATELLTGMTKERSLF